MASYRGVKFSRGVGFPDTHGNKVDTEVYGAAFKSLSDQVVNPAGAGHPPVYQLNPQRAKQFFLSTLSEGAATTLLHAVTLEVQARGQPQNNVAPGACTYEELRRGFERLFASQNPGVQALQAESKVKHRPWMGEDVRTYADSLQNVWARQPAAFSEIGKLRQFKKGLCSSLHPKLVERGRLSLRERVNNQAIGQNEINELVEFAAAVEEAVQEDANELGLEQYWQVEPEAYEKGGAAVNSVTGSEEVAALTGIIASLQGQMLQLNREFEAESVRRQEMGKAQNEGSGGISGGILAVMGCEGDSRKRGGMGAAEEVEARKDERYVMAVLQRQAAEMQCKSEGLERALASKEVELEMAKSAEAQSNECMAVYMRGGAQAAQRQQGGAAMSPMQPYGQQQPQLQQQQYVQQQPQLQQQQYVQPQA